MKVLLQYTPPPRTVVVNSDKDCRWGRKIFVKEFRLNDVRFFLDGLCYIQNIRILLKLHSNTTPPLGQFFHVLRSRQSNIIIQFCLRFLRFFGGIFAFSCFRFNGRERICDGRGTRIYHEEDLEKALDKTLVQTQSSHYMQMKRLYCLIITWFLQ